MDEGIKLEIFGTNELVKLFDELTKTNQNKIIKTGFRKSGNIILRQARANLAAGKKTTVKKRMEKRFRMEDIKENTTVTGVDIGNTSYFARWFEHGTAERFNQRKTKHFRKTDAGVTSRGKIIGLHFLENATESKGEEAVNSLYETINRAFELLIKKYSK